MNADQLRHRKKDREREKEKDNRKWSIEFSIKSIKMQFIDNLAYLMKTIHAKLPLPFIFIVIRSPFSIRTSFRMFIVYILHLISNKCLSFECLPKMVEWTHYVVKFEWQFMNIFGFWWEREGKKMGWKTNWNNSL